MFSFTTGELLLMQAISVTQAGKPADKLELAFRLYDIDRNGTIDQQEMTDIITVQRHIVVTWSCTSTVIGWIDILW